MAQNNKTVYVLDAFALIYRSYFAFISRPLRDGDGRNVSALFGFYTTLIKILKEYPVDYLVVALDSMTPTFRHEMYKEYKANREAAPEDLHEQVPRILEILDAANIPHIRVDGWEADDIIASIAKEASLQGLDTVMVTGDKDLLQLVDEHVSALRPPRNGSTSYRMIHQEDVLEEFSIRTDQIVDYLSLIGDSSDNIPGVKGIGPKGAVKLLSEFDTLDNIYEHIEEHSPSVSKKLAESREMAYLSRDLVVLQKDVPTGIEFESDRYTAESIDWSKAIPLFQKAKATSLIASVGESVKKKEPTDSELNKSGSYPAVMSLDELSSIFEKIPEGSLMALDFETTDIDETKAEPVGFSFAFEAGKAFYVPLKAEGKELIDAPSARDILSTFLHEKKIRIIGQNIKYDYKIMVRWGIDDVDLFFDTMIAAWLLDSSVNTYNMDSLARSYLDGYVTIHFEDVVPKGSLFSDITLEKALPYAAEDADITFRLYQVFSTMLEKEKLKDLFFTLEMPLLPILARMELSGIYLDREKMEAYGEEISERLEKIEKQVYEEVGHEFNMNSTKQLQTVLFDERGLPHGKKNKTGYSTAIDVLERLALLDDVPRLIVQNRSLVKLKNTYIDVLPLMINEETGRVHTSFTQTGTATGRLSSRNPNLQNIPIKSDDGRRIRDAFTAEEGSVLLSADYSQIELVVLAHMSGDPALSAAFIEGEDIHKRTAGLIFDIHPEFVSPDERRIAKVINFGVIYGMSAFRLSNELGISRAKAAEFIDSYFARFSRVTSFMEDIVKGAEESGKVETLLGRRRLIPEIHSSNKTVRQGAERIAVNTVIQGSAADIMKRAMLDVSREIAERGLASRLTLQVHDELIFEVPLSEVAEMKALVQETMEEAVPLSVPMRVSIETGKSWGEMH